MAGIGFVVRKLVKKDNLTGLFTGYLFSTIITAGPWLFTILALGSITLFGQNFSTLEEINDFRLCIIYNFSCSLVFSGPLTIIVTRFIADKIYMKDVHEVPGVLIGALGLSFFLQLPLVVGFYFYYIDLPLEIKLAAFSNYFLISGIWMTTVFMTALKDYNSISITFAVGMITGIASAFFLGKAFSQTGLFWGFNLGLGTILFSLIARVLAEYPYQSTGYFGFMAHFKKYWELALCGLFYNLAIWADKWIMWLSPERQSLVNGFISYPNYDSAMFLAYLTIIPSMAIFFVNIETNFFEKYVHFYQEIQGHATYEQIRENQNGIIQNLFDSFRGLFLFQGVISMAAIFLAPTIFLWLKINFLMMGIFRLGVLGAFFHIMSMFIFIVLYYFDFRKVAMWLNFLLLASNVVFTYVTLEMGFSFYGFGYFLSSLVTFTVSYGVTYYYLRTLPYRTFISNNSTIS
jgi:uncharacterized membrane protein